MSVVPFTILIVEDDVTLNRGLVHVIKKMGYDVYSTKSGEQALKQIKQHSFDLVISDFKLPGIDGKQVLKAAKKYDADIMFIMITAYGTVDTAVSAMKEGAEDYILKPFDMEELKVVVKKTLEKKSLLIDNIHLKRQLKQEYSFDNIIGNSPSMMEVFKTIHHVKDSKSTVLIRGETGTGKELVAKAIHYNGDRAAKPYIPVNCAAINENLMNSELFGHVKGAYTGAISDKQGFFEAADGGTLFLDEIGDIGKGLQQALLRAIESGEIRPVGSFKRKIVQVRIIAATNRNLEDMVKKGRFREDLYYRLNVVTISLPPLRERIDDVALLAFYFLRRYAAQNNKQIDQISYDALKLMEKYNWPGNVRELENIIERATLFEESPALTVESLPSIFRHSVSRSPRRNINSLDQMNRTHIEEVLESTGGNKTEASKILGINRSTLYRIMKRFKIQ
ncbi:sigma-54-dependent Fis family transcriptional regulator [Desulfobacter hydrogenophilus]|uniref:Sigma-54-dependent Fis family transcriptional regulator n=1 Tax=Desulfobacter hydrogenophilus TaxID=2291 RepID=A0A328FDZ5_9BACT|nr:sigma-54 dependent transcriptional regulator [Desulfobacter hydrogenophilus]NDY71169.1 sigma-54-dependent Fis family transcriptional regulator [Desulfobacter hydrogenophilus]QBH14231.1 sigma-54-dependent Fis family transcriptional regulator [Desulfobacter hydrogenophilus]RAM02838.1 sigma-54-dependent Fis family transcriptional regulator [Desulfobacter hydrogenophilus]